MLLLLQLFRSHRGEAAARADEVGGDGDIKITLLWDFAGDVDLHVEQPCGTELSYINMDTSDEGGGVLDVDNRTGGEGAAENAYWRRPSHGHYVVRVQLYRMDEDSPEGGVVHVVVKINGRQQQYNVRLTEEREDVTVIEFDY